MDIKIKQCSECREIGSIKDFCKNKSHKDGYDNWCRKCKKEYMRGYYKNNVNHFKEYYKNNAENQKEYKKNDPEKWKEYRKEWNSHNLEKRKEHWKRANEKRMSNPIFYLSSIISRSIRRSLNNKKDGRHWETLVNFSLFELKLHLEKQFKDGMSWENQGKWHIDHIYPVSLWRFESYNDREFKQCWALCNLQPLWALDNFKKNNRLSV